MIYGEMLKTSPHIVYCGLNNLFINYLIDSLPVHPSRRRVRGNVIFEHIIDPRQK